MPHTFDWIEIRTADIARTASFYEQLFGWTILNKTEADGTPVWILDTGGEPRLENLRRGGIWLRPAGQDQGVVVYVHVQDIAATLQRVTALGGTIDTPTMPVGRGHAAFFRDPGGTLLGLYQD